MAVVGHRRRAAVIGGGVVGCAVLWELARNDIEAVLLEAEPDLGEGASKANSGIIHTGFDTRPGTLESRLVRRAAALWHDVLGTLSVPSLSLGAVMVARTPEEYRRVVGRIEPNARALGVATALLDRSALRDLAPFVVDTAVGGLLVPGEAVVDPFWLTRAFAEAAMSAGAEVRTACPVVDLMLVDDGVEIWLSDGTTIQAEQVFDCAGLQADEVARLIGDGSFEISPRKGQFLVSEETFGVDRIVLPVPGGTSKGMLVTPIVFGGLLLGPTATDQTDKSDRATDPATRAEIVAACATLAPDVQRMKSVRSFAGLRTVSASGDYVVRPSTVSDRLFLLAGIRSTGISASPAIAELAVREAMRMRGWSGRTARSLAPPPIDDRPPGEILCLCRSISRGEVETACRRPTVPRTLDAVKRRSGAMFGDCQGNDCTVGIARVVAAERGVPLESIRKGTLGSWVFAGRNPVPPPSRDNEIAEPTKADVVIIGGGLAGVGAALGLADAGVEYFIVERRAALMRPIGDWTEPEAVRLGRLPDRPGRGLNVRLSETVVGLIPEDGGWRVLAQGSRGTVELVAGTVIIATGGYVEPAEHRAIAGPRLAGIQTADFVAGAIEAGLVPGERAVVIGAGRLADATAHLLEAVGCRIVARAVSGVEAVRGRARLEAVRLEGGWIDCDTLVLADRLLASLFILRGLGLVDARPGVAAPAAPDGSLPVPGLWAAGTCVKPDIDHRGSLADGLLVGEAVAQVALAGARPA